jgi:uncharacterized protein
MRIVRDLSEVGADAWNALLRAAPSENPFVRYEFLHALHESGCVCARTGWEPHYLALERDGRLCAAVPLYRKLHSYGEYVFDWAWADAHHQHGLEYYPKWLSAVPFTPVPGPRLIAIDAEARDRAAQALVQLAQDSGLSSLHVLFPGEEEARCLADLGALSRQTVQFHWFNRGYSTFHDYLGQLAQPKRKKVRAERRKVISEGVRVRRLVGTEITAADWSLFARCYRNTYAAHHSTPYLNARFFSQLATTMPDNLLLVIASRRDKDIAAALALFDTTRLYGRYWGTLASVPCLHFEVSYYQLIEFAIERRLHVIEGGAQGEHKLARGFEPVKTWSCHWLRHPDFAQAVERYLERESGGIEAYVDELHERSAYRTPAGPP